MKGEVLLRRFRITRSIVLRHLQMKMCQKLVRVSTRASRAYASVWRPVRLASGG